MNVPPTLRSIRACLEGAIVAVMPGPCALRLPVPDGLAVITVVPEERVSTDAARRAMPAAVPVSDAAFTLSRGIGLALALSEGRLDDLPDLLHDRIHEPYRGPMVPGLEALRGVVDGEGCLGATISGSGRATRTAPKNASSDDWGSRTRSSTVGATLSSTPVVSRGARWSPPFMSSQGPPGRRPPSPSRKAARRSSRPSGVQSTSASW